MGVGARPRGQAAVEMTGLILAIALLVAATALWLVRELRPPPRPPDVIGHVVAPLGIEGAGLGEHWWSREDLPARLELAGRRHYSAGVRGVLSEIGRGTVDTYELFAISDRAFRRRFAARLRERGRQFLDDPLGGLASMPDAGILTPGGAADRALRRVDDVYAYVQELRRLSPEQAAAKLGGDLGETSADLAIEAAQAALRKRVGRAIRRTPAHPRTPSGDAPRP